MTTVLVLGAYGLLGGWLVPHLREAGHHVLGQGRSPGAQVRADLLDLEVVRGMLEDHRPDVVVNLAAATNVDRCEEDPQAAFAANTRLVEVVVEALEALPGTQRPALVQISTDQVYDGAGPHDESAVRPCNVYAITKYGGEQAAARAGATVLRTNFVGRSRSPGRSGLTDWIVTSLRDGRRITVFDDVLFSAWHVSALCGAIATIVSRPAPGVFNAGCRDGISKAQFALRLAAALGLPGDGLTIGSSNTAVGRARRPNDMRLDVRLFEHAFGVRAPAMDAQIRATAADYRDA